MSPQPGSTNTNQYRHICPLESASFLRPLLIGAPE